MTSKSRWNKQIYNCDFTRSDLLKAWWGIAKHSAFPEEITVLVPLPSAEMDVNECRAMWFQLTFFYQLQTQRMHTHTHKHIPTCTSDDTKSSQGFFSIWYYIFLFLSLLMLGKSLLKQKKWCSSILYLDSRLTIWASPLFSAALSSV